MDLVSIILPVFKIEPQFLEASLQSILKQTYKNLEINIILDESNDKELDKKLEQKILEKNDNRIKLKKRKSSGFVSALNEGISMSIGKYIARMDGDDISELNRIEKQIKFLAKNNLDLIGSWAYVITEDNIIGKLEPPTTHNEIRNKIILHNPILHTSLFVKKSVFDSIGGYDQNYMGAEDYEIYTRAIWRGFQIGNIPEYLVCIRENPLSIVRNSDGWKKTRKAYIKTKRNAIKNYGMNRFNDIIYGSLSPLTYLISPKRSLYAKKKIGWFKPIKPRPYNTYS